MALANGTACHIVSGSGDAECHEEADTMLKHTSCSSIDLGVRSRGSRGEQSHVMLSGYGAHCIHQNNKGMLALRQ